MAYADLDEIAQRTDRALAGVEASSTALLTNALVEAYNDLEQDLIRRYEEEPQGGLFPQQRALAIMQDIQFSLRMIDPLSADLLEAQFAELLGQGGEIGHAMASDMMAAVTAREADEFTGADMPVEAIAAQARDGLGRLSGHTETFANRATTLVQQGLIQGWSPRRLTQAIQTTLGTTTAQAETIARTETLSSHNSAALQRYTDNGVEYWQRFPVLDSRVCRYCQARAFNVYRIEDNAAVLLHPNDRCIAAPYDPEWEEDGLIDTEEIERWEEQTVERAEEDPASQSDLAPFERGLNRPPTPALTGGDVIAGKTIAAGDGRPPEPVEPIPTTAKIDIENLNETIDRNANAFGVNRRVLTNPDFGTDYLPTQRKTGTDSTVTEAQREDFVRSYGVKSRSLDFQRLQMNGEIPGPPPYPEELAAIFVYSGSEFLDVNRHLRDGEYGTNVVLDTFADVLSSGVQQMETFQGPVYRIESGRNLGRARTLYNRVGEIIELPAFTSASRVQNATLAGKVSIEIYSRNGRAIESVSDFAHEREILFDRNSRFKVLRYEEDPNGEISVILREV